MDDRQRNHFREWASVHEAEMERAIPEAVNSVHSQHSARGTTWSSHHADSVVRRVVAALDAYAASALTKAREIAPTTEMWRLATETVRLSDSNWRARLDKLVWPGSNTRHHARKGSEGYRAVFQAFDVAALMRGQRAELARFEFDDKPSPSQASGSPAPTATAKPPKTLAGRLPADWWDDLWIEIFRQIHLGDLKPTKQADIVQAMLQWLSDRDVHVSEGTVKPRARKLMAMLRTMDD